MLQILEAVVGNVLGIEELALEVDEDAERSGTKRS